MTKDDDLREEGIIPRIPALWVKPCQTGVRVRILGVVVHYQPQGSFSFLLDDGTAVIRVVWGEEVVRVGDLVDVVGVITAPRKEEGDKGIGDDAWLEATHVVTCKDPNAESLRCLEMVLNSQMPSPQQQEEEVVMGGDDSSSSSTSHSEACQALVAHVNRMHCQGQGVSRDEMKGLVPKGLLDEALAQLQTQGVLYRAGNLYYPL